MTTTVSTPAPPAHSADNSDPGLPGPGAFHEPYELRLSAEVARQLGRYITPIVARVEEAVAERTGTTDRLTIDLTDASTVPGISLIVLVNLLRHTLAPGAVITLSGVRPPVMSSLVAFGLPHGTVVVDSRGREWVG